MCPARRVLVLLSVLGFVVGIINADNFNKPATDSKLELEDFINKILDKRESKFLDKLLTYIDSKTDAINNKIPQLEKRIKIIEEKIDQTSDASNNTIHVLEVKITETLARMKKELLELNKTLTNISCGKLPPLPHGSVELLNGTTHLGSVVQYSCATNYQLVGPARRTCAEDFQWSESSPTCEVDCGKLPPLPHGLADLLNGTTHLGSVVQYSCATNYRLVGPARRTCAEDFQWSETAPTCEVDCGKLPPLPHGLADLLNGTTHLGSVVQYSCATNYRLVGPARRTCAEDLQWSETAPTCEVLPCKEQTVAQNSVTPDYSVDAVSLHYGTLRRDSAGHRAHFELHFALQADEAVDIVQSQREGYSGIRYYITIGGDSNQLMWLVYNGDRVQDISTPDILSATEFRSFYIKVDDGKLQFGKEGDPPLISYSGFDLDSLNFYRFDTRRGSTSIRFCPAAVEG